jgi:hypothetical protein
MKKDTTTGLRTCNGVCRELRIIPLVVTYRVVSRPCSPLRLLALRRLATSPAGEHIRLLSSRLHPDFVTNKDTQARRRLEEGARVVFLEAVSSRHVSHIVADRIGPLIDVFSQRRIPGRDDPHAGKGIVHDFGLNILSHSLFEAAYAEARRRVRVDGVGFVAHAGNLALGTLRNFGCVAVAVGQAVQHVALRLLDSGAPFASLEDGAVVAEAGSFGCAFDGAGLGFAGLALSPRRGRVRGRW